MLKEYARLISFEDIINAMDRHHSIYNRSAVYKAHEFAMEKHEGILRKTGESYIMHPRRVALFLANMGCESDVVIAALLHDVVEDNETVSLEDIQMLFGSDVARMVDGVTKIDKNLEQFKGLSRQELHNLTDTKLYSMVSDVRVLYIKLADRRDNLYTIEGMKPMKQLEKATHTREILIPLALRIGAEKIANELEELCFRTENATEYNNIASAFHCYRDANLYGINNTLSMLKNAVSTEEDDERLVSPSSYYKLVHHLKIGQRSFISIHRQLTREADNIRDDFNKLLSKDNIAWYDLTLVLHDKVMDNPEFNNSFEVFYKIYEECLISKGIYILRTCMTTRRDSSYVLLCDQYGNMFRVFVKTYDEYMHYKLGNIIDTYKGLTFQGTDDLTPASDPAELKDKIKVFKRNGAAAWINNGATVLDFAFMIHSEIGLHFDHALLNDSQEFIPAYHRLNVGDRVTIVTSDVETAEIRWFKYLKTSDAVQNLYHYYCDPENLRVAMERARERMELR